VTGAPGGRDHLLLRTVHAAPFLPSARFQRADGRAGPRHRRQGRPISSPWINALDLTPGATLPELLAAMMDRVLAEGELVGTCERKPGQ
jgi:hypothetical protein